MDNDTINSKNIPMMNEMISIVLAERCTRDAKFMETLQNGDLESILGERVVEVFDQNNIAVETVRNTDDVVHIVLPCYATLDAAAGAVMTDKQLRAVSGGAFEIIALCTTVGVGVSVALGFVFGPSAVVGIGSVTALGAGVLIAAAAVTVGVVGGVSVGLGVGLGLQNEDSGPVNVGLAS